MQRSNRYVSYTLCLALAAAAAVTGWYRAFLPAEISIAADSRGGVIAGTELRLSEGEAEFMLCGIPLKRAAVSEEPRRYVCPGGTPFGIKLRTEGVLVITVRKGSPAAEAGLKSGDVILSVNDCDVNSNSAVSAAVQLKDECEVVFRRGDSVQLARLAPEGTEGEKKLGLWVRDSAAGLGTLTFYDPETGLFGGLGHPVSDADTGDLMPLSEGELTAAEITGAVKGESGAAGELCGVMLFDEVIGELSANTEVGIFGTGSMSGGEKLPVAFRQEVDTGSAEILTTIDGTTPIRCSIEIEHINLCDLNGSRSMVVHITDEELLSKTGGIVRGMSGSPIIQNGRLVGAVTHVFLSDPTRGYAVFAETMLENAAKEMPQ